MIKENKSYANTGFKKFIFYLRWFLNSKFYPISIGKRIEKNLMKVKNIYLKL